MLSGKNSPVFKFQVKGTNSHKHQKPKNIVEEDIFENLDRLEFGCQTVDNTNSTEPDLDLEKIRCKTRRRQKRNQSMIHCYNPKNYAFATQKLIYNPKVTELMKLTKLRNNSYRKKGGKCLTQECVSPAGEVAEGFLPFLKHQAELVPKKSKLKIRSIEEIYNYKK